MSSSACWASSVAIAQCSAYATLRLRKRGRHLQIGLTTQAEQGEVALPIDLIVLKEATIIGSLGILNDITVTQASAVWELHLADPSAPAARLYRSAMRIGRDHIASTVYTLFLAYAGAALPLLVLFTLTDRGFTEVVTGELVGEEVVRTLVGSIGLVAAVPITTALAVALVMRIRGSEAAAPVA